MKRLDPDVKRLVFAVLGGVAILDVVLALVLALLAVPNVGVWLVTLLVILVLVVAAEVVLLVLDRPPRPHRPHPHYGPGYGGRPPEEDEVIHEFVPVEDDEPEPAR